MLPTIYYDVCAKCGSEDLNMIGDPEYNDEWYCNQCKDTTVRKMIVENPPTTQEPQIEVKCKCGEGKWIAFAENMSIDICGPIILKCKCGNELDLCEEGKKAIKKLLIS